MRSRQLQLHDPAVILMVDDNEHGLIARKNVLKQEGFESITARSAEEGLELLQTHRFDLVVTDYRMGGMDGIEFIAHLRQRSPGTPVILLSGFVEPLGLDESSTGADAVLSKSANEAASLVRTVNRLLTRRPMRKPVNKETRAKTPGDAQYRLMNKGRAPIGRFLPLLAVPFLAILGMHPALLPAAPATAPKKVVRAAPVMSREARALQRWMRPMTLRDEVAQMVMISFTGRPLNTRSREFRKIADYIRRDHVGGMILVNVTQGRLVQKADPLEAAHFIDSMQTLSRVPLLIGGDLERGASMRLEGTTMFPHAMAFTAGGDPAAARVEGEVTAREARAIGINWVFFPVMDVNSNPDNPIINIRSFGENPEEVGRFGQAFIEGAHSVPANYIITTAKHFPGHGDTATDTHINLATINSDRKHLDTVEFVPFRTAIAAGVDSIMTAHLAVPALEAPDLPATLSPLILTTVLREQLGFKGIVITDALEMGGIAKGFTIGEASVRAVKAGADVLLMPRDPVAAIDAVVAAVRRGEIDRKRIQASVRRLLEAKVRVDLDIHPHVDLKKVPDIVNAPENSARADAITARALTLVRNEGNLIPLNKTAKTCFVAMVESHNGQESDQFAAELRQVAPGVPLFSIAPDEAKGASAAILSTPCDTYVVAAWVSVAGYRGNVVLGGDLPDLLNSIIATNKPVVLVGLGNPYIVRSFAGVKSYLATFSTIPSSEAAAVKALYGLIPITGKLPVSIPGIAAYHSGINVQ